MLTKVWKEIGRVSVVEVLNSNNLAESPRPRSNIKARVWSPQQLSGEIQTYNLGYSRVLSTICRDIISLIYLIYFTYGFLLKWNCFNLSVFPLSYFVSPPVQQLVLRIWWCSSVDLICLHPSKALFDFCDSIKLFPTNRLDVGVAETKRNKRNCHSLCFFVR